MPPAPISRTSRMRVIASRGRVVSTPPLPRTPQRNPKNRPATSSEPLLSSSTTTSSSQSSVWSPFSRLFSRSAKSSSSTPRPPAARGKTWHYLRILLPLIPIVFFFTENFTQVMWVRGPSMSPCLNEGYEQTNTESDMVLVNMFPFRMGLKVFGKTRLERGMIVTFWYVFLDFFFFFFFFFFWKRWKCMSDFCLWCFQK